MNIEITREKTYGMLTGDEIIRQVENKNIEIDPFDINRVNPNSYNVRLHPKLLVYSIGPYIMNNYIDSNNKIPLTKNINYLDSKLDNPIIEQIIPEDGYILQPGVLYIGRTVERTFTDKFIPMINGRSSGGRLGISVHVCAGFGDIGFNGTWTLEITAVQPVKIYPNMEIAQICWFTPAGDTDILYDGKYNNQIEPTASRFYKDEEK